MKAMNKRNFLLLYLMLYYASTTFGYELNEVIEAESATLIGNAEIVSKEFASNGDFVKLHKTPVGSLELTIENIVEAGSYKLLLYAFNDGVTQSVDLSINGGEYSPVIIQPSNWAYEDSAKLSVVEVELMAGSNTLTFTANQTSILLDKFIVKSRPNYNQPNVIVIMTDDLGNQLESLGLDAVVTGENNYEVLWTSSNSSVCTVDEKGFVLTHSEGAATITANVLGQENLSATCKKLIVQVMKSQKRSSILILRKDYLVGVIMMERPLKQQRHMLEQNL